MQILRDLSDLCKKALTELSDAQLKAGSLKSEVENLLAKKEKLESDAQAAFEELKNVNLKVREERAREIDLIDQRSQDATLVKAQAEAELQKHKALTVDLQNKTDAAAQQKADAEALIASLKAQQATMDDKLAKINAFQAAIK